MARQVRSRDLAPVLAAAGSWINRSLVQDQSIFSEKQIWTAPLVGEVTDRLSNTGFWQDSFIDKLKGQFGGASSLGSNFSVKCFGPCSFFLPIQKQEPALAG